MHGIINNYKSERFGEINIITVTVEPDPKPEQLLFLHSLQKKENLPDCGFKSTCTVYKRYREKCINDADLCYWLK